MIRQKRKFLGAVLSIVAIGMTISSCGRRGALEAPKPIAPKSTIADQSDGDRKNTSKKTDKQISKPERYFFLDGLIQ